MDKFQKLFQLIKVDVAQRLVYGLVTAEREDKDGETCDYDSTKPEYKTVNDEMSKASDGQNIMPLREMHQLNAVGAGKSIEFDDAKKEIRMAFKVVDDSTWNKVLEKVLIGFSQGGRYVKRWTEGAKKMYTAAPGEVSLVDNPCLSGAVIQYVKADGSVEDYIAPSIARLSESDVDRIVKALSSELSTQAEKKSAEEAEAVRKRNAAKGEPMNKEQIEKCAKALGITVEEFTKQFVEGDLMKGAKGMAAVHSHLETMQEHHGEMGKCHKAMMGHHEKMGAHIEKCMKAASDVMGSEGEKGEKAFKALLDELHAAAKTAGEGPETVKKEEVEKMISDAVTKAVDDLKKSMPMGDAADGVRIVPRDAEFEKAVAAAAGSTPDPIMR